MRPVVHGFALTGEYFIDASAARLRGREVLGGQDRYRALLEHKRERRLSEPYTWFRPFNESTRALEPFRQLLQDTVQPGTPILDLWCRTGWTGEMLASWFPDNPVVSMWEGDTDSLGYQGYLYWLGEADRATNLEVVFASPGQPLPFPDDYFSLVHGLDTLHRYPHAPLVGECLRVAAHDAPLVFPHVHLTNSEPDPYFDRGCMQYHGETWGQFLEAVGDESGRAAWVLSEKALYVLDEQTRLADDRSTAHYNGFVVLGPAAWKTATLAPPQLEVSNGAYLFANPLLSIDPVRGSATISGSKFEGAVDHMTIRHPVAVEALAEVTSRQLTSTECQILGNCRQPTTVATMAARLECSTADIAHACQALVSENALQIESVSTAMAHLQLHYETQLPERRPTFCELWQALEQRYGTRPVVETADGSTFDLTDLNQLVTGLRSWFAEQEFEAGARIGVVAANHVEYLVSVWATWLSGLVIVPLSPDFSASQLGTALDRAQVVAVFCDDASWPVVNTISGDRPCIVLDPVDADPQPNRRYFIDVVAERLHEEPLDVVSREPNDLAAIVSTSGSTGEPKAVKLSMASLMHTAASITEVLDLDPQTRLLSLAPIHTMSGLRNPLVAALRAGATVVIDTACAESALGIVNACRRYEVTTLAASPAFLDRLVALEDRVRVGDLRALRIIATTADRVASNVVEEIEHRFGLRVIDYYGMTETGGIVVVATPHSQGALGTAIGAAVEVHVDGRRAEIGEQGEVRVSGPSVMLGYLDDTTGVRFEAGWVYTGDLAVAHTDGSLTLLGRVTDQIKRRNGEIYPHLSVVAALTAVDGVGDAHIVIDQHSRQIVANVTAASGCAESDLRDALQELGPGAQPDRYKIDRAAT